jgi:hypothetical protein
MKSLIFGAALLAASLPALAQNVSISVGQPGFYGHIDIGDAPRPALVYSNPVIIAQPRYQVAPMYLRVPPYHRAHWANYCNMYSACGAPVYFVTDDWYQRVYVPHYREVYRYGPPRGEWREHERREAWREHERREEWRDHERREEHDRGRHEGWDRGEGHGRGHGHDRD